MKRKFLISIMCLTMLFSIMKPTNDVNAEGRAEGANATISVSYNSSFAIQQDGSLWAWGRNFDGNLGDGTTTSRRTPVKVMDNVDAVSAALSHTAVVTNDGVLWIWGSDNIGFLCEDTGKHMVVRHIEPMKIAENVATVSAGSGYTMFITNDGYLWGWGLNGGGRLGDGTTVHRRTPVQIMDNVVAVSAGSGHTAAITADGYLWTWGSNGSGQLGDGTTEERHAPVKIMGDVTAVYAGRTLTSAITSDGVLWSWGRNYFMENADETIDPLYILNKEPMPIAEDVVAVSATSFITSDGGLWFWGMGSARSINSLEFSFGAIIYKADVWGEFIEIPWQPQPVRIMDNVIAVAAASHIMVITSDNELWGWGNNLDHQIGIGSSIIDVDSPVRIMDSVMIPSNRNWLIYH